MSTRYYVVLTPRGYTVVTSWQQCKILRHELGTANCYHGCSSEQEAAQFLKEMDDIDVSYFCMHELDL